jgi:hypothetical protein
VNKVKLATLAVVASAVLVSPASMVDASAGKSCSKVGSLSGTSNKPLVCKRVKKKLVWVSNKVVTGKAPGVLYQPIKVSYLYSLGMYVSWVFPYDSGSSDVLSYRIEYMANAPGFPWTFLMDVGPRQFGQYVKDDGLIGYSFRFRIAAVNRHGIGPFSESDWVFYGASTSVTTTTIPSSSGKSVTTTTTYVAPTTTTTTSPYTTSQIQATKSAASYLKYSAFSRSGLIGQLEYEGFSNADAIHGVDRQGADWNAQAAKMAASYLKYSSFSRSGLIGQLVYEGFTQSQAEYGVSTTGL